MGGSPRGPRPSLATARPLRAPSPLGPQLGAPPSAPPPPRAGLRGDLSHREQNEARPPWGLAPAHPFILPTLTPRPPPHTAAPGASLPFPCQPGSFPSQAAALLHVLHAGAITSWRRVLLTQPSPPFLPRGLPLFTQQPVYSVPAVPSPHLVSRVELPEFRSWLYHLPAVGPWASYSASVCLGLLIIKWVTNSTDTVEQLQ